MFAPGYFARGFFAPGYFPPGDVFIPPEPEPEQPEGGGRGRKRRSKYPRRVKIEDRIYWVQSPEEERALLRAYIERLRERAREEATERGATSIERVEATRRLIVRAMGRLEAVDTRERDWLDVLRAEDEEILLVLLH